MTPKKNPVYAMIPPESEDINHHESSLSYADLQPSAKKARMNMKGSNAATSGNGFAATTHPSPRHDQGLETPPTATKRRMTRSETKQYAEAQTTTNTTTDTKRASSPQFGQKVRSKGRGSSTGRKRRSISAPIAGDGDGGGLGFQTMDAVITPAVMGKDSKPAARVTSEKKPRTLKNQSVRQELFPSKRRPNFVADDDDVPTITPSRHETRNATFGGGNGVALASRFDEEHSANADKNDNAACDGKDRNKMDDDEEEENVTKGPVRRLCFGRVVRNFVSIQSNVSKVYGLIRGRTGSLGGNGSQGPIYGELTAGSMQKMVNLMKQYTGFCASSRFLDVGSGIGKPNLHVIQDPGVQCSLGVEVEKDRWLLGMSSLQAVLKAVHRQQQQLEASTVPTLVSRTNVAATSTHTTTRTRKDNTGETSSNSLLGHRCLFVHADIRDAKSFDPFSHVYMFSIGFPPQLWDELSAMWNRSHSKYLICFHSPKDIIECYDFRVKLIVQAPTSMHGSKEGHTGYVYERCCSTLSRHRPSNNKDENDTYVIDDKAVAATQSPNDVPCNGNANALTNHEELFWDDFFVEPCRMIESGLVNLMAHVDAEVEKCFQKDDNNRPIRVTRRRSS